MNEYDKESLSGDRVMIGHTLNKCTVDIARYWEQFVSINRFALCAIRELFTLFISFH